MARIHDSIIRKGIEFAEYTMLELIVATAGEIGPADAGIEECVTAEQYAMAVKADLVRAVPRSEQHFKMKVVDVDLITIGQEKVGLGYAGRSA